MLEFEQFIEDIIDKRGINENDKLELKYEISSHLLLLKNEYLEKGYDEKTSVKLAIDSFGNSNLIGNALKASLPSKNKYDKFTIKNMTKLICNMILLCLVYMFFFICAFNKNTNSSYFTIGIPLIEAIFSYLCINIKINNPKNAIKSIIICNASLYIILKIFGTLVMIVAILLFGNPYPAYRSLSLTLLGFFLACLSRFFIPSLLFTIISVIFTKLFNKIIFINIRNIYENKITSILMFSLSILLWIGYYLLPNSNLILRKILTNLIKSNDIHSQKTYYI
ncbi:hypothetical protein CFSAN002367_18578 [Clostridium botulinum CFSAN002367]|nr:hypothetical protein CFSAN002367_18578 [Clostridium botulinum CFSAN002367]